MASLRVSEQLSLAVLYRGYMANELVTQLLCCPQGLRFGSFAGEWNVSMFVVFLPSYRRRKIRDMTGVSFADSFDFTWKDKMFIFLFFLPLFAGASHQFCSNLKSEFGVQLVEFREDM